jgi:hypothetical protein
VEELTKQLQLKDNTAISWGKQQLRPSSMFWQTYLISQFQINWWTKEQNTTQKQVTCETTSELLLMCQYQDWMLE